MKVTVKQESATVPSAFITMKKQRIKQYNDNVFLHNGDEFEIELFNPTQEKILAQIELNGSSLGSGIILRPGERVFLERHFDTPKKFLFETYDVNGNDKNVMKAIEKNGVVNVKFYQKYIPIYLEPWTVYNPVIINPIPINPWPINPWPITSPFYYTSDGTPGGRTFSGGSTSCSFDSSIKSSDNMCFYNSVGSVTNKSPESYTYTSASLDLNCNFEPKTKKRETGRIEEGSKSNQKFITDNTSFNSFWSWETTWKILPFSRKMYTKDDINVFCTNCGTKRKKESHQFCPNCGTKF